LETRHTREWTQRHLSEATDRRLAHYDLQLEQPLAAGVRLGERAEAQRDVELVGRPRKVDDAPPGCRAAKALPPATSSSCRMVVPIGTQ
jgi:hypothetical protein